MSLHYKGVNGTHMQSEFDLAVIWANVVKSDVISLVFNLKTKRKVELEWHEEDQK
jgi:hypothetical protein